MKKMIEDGLSLEINSIDDLVSEAKKLEVAKKTAAYY